MRQLCFYMFKSLLCLPMTFGVGRHPVVNVIVAGLKRRYAILRSPYQYSSSWLQCWECDVILSLQISPWTNGWSSDCVIGGPRLVNRIWRITFYPLVQTQPHPQNITPSLGVHVQRGTRALHCLWYRNFKLDLVDTWHSVQKIAWKN